jgi:uncharacterized YigZ family protein
VEIHSYKTILQPSEGFYKEKGSKFLGFAFPVQSETAVKEQLLALRKKYYDARHHCYAYILGENGATYRAVDDGEPNHSAGDPILGQIRSKNLTNALVVVVRYFGGTKLGVGGLVSAYKTAAEDALNHAIVIEKEVTRTLQIEYPYTSTPEVMKLVKDFELEITDQHFQEHCMLVATLKVKLHHLFLEKFNLLNALGHTLTMKWL